MMKRILSICSSLLCVLFVCAQQQVDTRIAVNDEKDPNTFVVIVSNEHYKYEQPVPFALNDGETFRLYCEKTLGIPAKNIRYVGDATLNDMRMQLHWLQKVMKAFNGQARAMFYYSGHGMPSEDGNHAYLLPVDGNSTLAGSGLSTADLYKQLGSMPSRQTLVLLDACFSGARRDGQMLSASRGVAIRAKAEPVSGSMVVFSAAQGNETAYPFTEMRHGLFTYYILEQLQEHGGCVTLGDLSDYVTTKVRQMSIIENDKDQTPMVTASNTAANWRSWSFAPKAAKRYETVARKATTAPASASAPASVPVNAAPASAAAGNLQPQQPAAPVAPPQLTGDKVTCTVGNVQFNMIRVEGGTFMMGATSDQKKPEKDGSPVHRVTLSTYYIGETEVTQELWEAVMGRNPSHFKGMSLPVECVSWNDCQEFLLKLNQMTGLKFRLPTEAEWEYAARGGSKSRGYQYSGSDKIKNVAWYLTRETHDVKTKLPNELGIYDMSGNVSEWCQDWYGDYGVVAQTNPTGPSSGSYRVHRGGSWLSLARYCRVSFRSSSTPGSRHFILGLRLAL